MSYINLPLRAPIFHISTPASREADEAYGTILREVEVVSKRIENRASLFFPDAASTTVQNIHEAARASVLSASDVRGLGRRIDKYQNTFPSSLANIALLENNYKETGRLLYDFTTRIANILPPDTTISALIDVPSPEQIAQPTSSREVEKPCEPPLFTSEVTILYFAPVFTEETSPPSDEKVPPITDKRKAKKKTKKSAPSNVISAADLEIHLKAQADALIQEIQQEMEGELSGYRNLLSGIQTDLRSLIQDTTSGKNMNEKLKTLRTQLLTKSLRAEGSSNKLIYKKISDMITDVLKRYAELRIVP